MKSGMDLQSNMLIVPRDYSFTGIGPNKTNGLRWTNKYGFVGPNTRGQELGLRRPEREGASPWAVFYFPGNNSQTKTNKQNTNHNLASYQVVTYLLGNCVTVQDAITTLQHVQVWMANNNPHNTAGTWTYAVYDTQGHSRLIHSRRPNERP